MDNDKKLKLIKLSAEDFKTFKTQFETLSPTEKMEFKNYVGKVQDFLKDNENKKMEAVTGFPTPL